MTSGSANVAGPDGAITVVYIAGAGRSGSTLLEMLLRDRLATDSLGEAQRVWSAGMRWNSKCECGRRFDACDYWTRVVADFSDPEQNHRVEAMLREATTNRALVRSFFHPSTHPPEVLTSAVGTIYSNAAAVSGRSVLIDSSKSMPYCWLLSHVPGVRVLMVHLVRDSRAVAYSWTQAKPWKAGRAGAQMRTRSPASVARDWMIANTLGFFLRRRLGGLLIDYEDLAADPERVLDRVMERVGDELALPRRMPAPTGHGLMGNPVRFAGTPAHIMVDDRWVTQMKRTDRAVVTLLTLPGLLARRCRRITQRR